MDRAASGHAGGAIVLVSSKLVWIRRAKEATALVFAAAVTSGAAGQTPPTEPKEPRSDPGRSTLEAPIGLRVAAEIDPPLSRLVDRLEDASYAGREEATERLLEDTFDNAQLYAVLRGDLSPEQRHRLLTVVCQRLLGAPRGAVGIAYPGARVQPVSGRPFEIVVTDLLPDLPAQHLLMIGDRITHVDGRALQDARHFIVSVQSKAPGEFIRLRLNRVKRDEHEERVRDEQGQLVYETLEVELQLGSVENLRDANGNPPAQKSPVVLLRKDEALQATLRFAPRPRLIKIRGQPIQSDGPETEAREIR